VEAPPEVAGSSARGEEFRGSSDDADGLPGSEGKRAGIGRVTGGDDSGRIGKQAMHGPGALLQCVMCAGWAARRDRVSR
jgi:hypothetical protein